MTAIALLLPVAFLAAGIVALLREISGEPSGPVVLSCRHLPNSLEGVK